MKSRQQQFLALLGLQDCAMAESLPYLATFLSLLVGLGILFLKRIYWHPLSTFPGPILPATTSFYQFYVLWKGKEGPWYRGLHEKYGRSLVLRFRLLL